VITVTENAAKAILDLTREKGVSGGLRLSIEKGGCAGLQYAMELGAPGEGDETARCLEAEVYVAADSTALLVGCTLDYDDGLAGAGFRIINPKAARSCGCGTSFEPAQS